MVRAQVFVPTHDNAGNRLDWVAAEVADIFCRAIGGAHIHAEGEGRWVGHDGREYRDRVRIVEAHGSLEQFERLRETSIFCADFVKQAARQESVLIVLDVARERIFR